METPANSPRRHHERALVVMARAPRAGEVKTRLSPPLTGEESARFYECLLSDLLYLLGSGDRWDAWVAYTAGSYAYFRARGEAAFSLLCQRGNSLGTRMHGIFVDLFAWGYRSVVVVGSDIPGLTRTAVEQAFRMLETGGGQVVLGPSEDGGYHLIGLRRPMVGLFQGIAWSTRDVFEQTLERANGMHARVATVQSSYDVDAASDLERLWVDLQKSEVLRRRLRETYQWLRQRHAPG